MIKFIRRFRDADHVDKKTKLAKLYMPLDEADFDAKKESRLIKLGLAVKVDAKSKKETKNDAPEDENSIEKKDSKK